MKLQTKVLLSGIAAAMICLVGYREISAACGPQKVEGHEHVHGHGTGEAHGAEAHGNEGFGTRVCEQGLLSALFSTVSDQSPTSPARAAPDDGHNHGKESHDGKDDHGHGHGHGGEGGGEAEEGLVKLTPSQIKTAGIEMDLAASGTLSKEIAVPGRVTMNANAQARIVPKLTGTVASVNKQLGEAVTAGDLLATIDSRDMADAKAEYLAASRTEDLSRATFEREERLWRGKVTAEQDYLAARNAHEEAKIKLEVAHQKLHAIGLPDSEIEKLANSKDDGSFRLYELRAPISGLVTARDLVLGQSVDTAKEVFVIADPAKVWIEMAVSPNDLSFARQGQEVRVRSGTRQATGSVIALSPVIDPETRSAKAIAEIDNKDGLWKPGDYVEARLISGGQPVDILVPKGALQTIKGAKVVFVNEAAGFRARPVTTGREDMNSVEIVSGLEFGETVAISNTFTLKAELGKAEAEHEH